jgi:superfamily I DNA and/or RNA helicase/very-short-patch-repair endonuclease
LTLDSRKALHERVDRLCGMIINYLQLLEERDNIRSQSDNNPYSPILERLTKVQSSIHKNLQDAFILKRTNSVCSIQSEIKKNLSNATSLLARKNLPFLQQVVDIGVLNAAQDAFVQFAKFFPAWASTLLSLTKASPCVAGLFDRVIIDEASQCEIPPMIPALFRSKGVTIIGDPNQFPPVITMRENLHARLRYVKHELTDLDDGSFDYINRSAYDLLDVTPVLLREHFRCNEDIANYFNDAYYRGKLKFRTNIEALKFPKNMGFKRGLEWRDISTSLEDEMKEVETLLECLVRNGYDGTIGIITPFREVANNLATRLNRFTGHLEKFDINNDVNTANGFQGGERDLIIFVLALTDELSKGQEWYALADENKYIYNVAASRARACLIIVGNRQRALNYPSDVLRKLAQPLRPAKEMFQSPWEKKLYNELVKVGLNPKPQRALAGRYLDLALDEYTLDIEVDGQAYHLNKYGERKQDDVYRDLTITSCGWRVIRFWVNELKDDMDGCIAKIRDALK